MCIRDRLFDAVDSSVAAEFLQNVEETLAGRKLDYLVIHHMEPDHSSSCLLYTSFLVIELLGRMA